MLNIKFTHTQTHTLRWPYSCSTAQTTSASVLGNSCKRVKRCVACVSLHPFLVN